MAKNDITKGYKMANSIMTTQQLAQYLGVSVSLLNTYRAEGMGPVYLKLGRLVRYRLNDVEKWLSEKV